MSDLFFNPTFLGGEGGWGGGFTMGDLFLNKKNGEIQGPFCVIYF
jgi:hypothetical protein